MTLLPASDLPENAENSVPLLRMRGISKRFGQVTVLDQVDFEIYPGEVHVLAGENGAGKSTLIKILGGIYTEFEGVMEYGGRASRPRTPLAAGELEVAIIHQELSLVPAMSLADNIFLGRNPSSAGWVNDRAQDREAKKWVSKLGLDLDVRRNVEEFPIATQQLIEIAKALSQQARVLVLDEPTSALNAPEAEKLFLILDALKAEGHGIVYISHKMEEMDRLADRITVLRDGRRVGSALADDVNRAKFMEWMVGRDLGEQFPRRAPHPGNERLRVEKFSVFGPAPQRKHLVREVSLSVRAGEILGVGGLQGAGASELFAGLFGAVGNQTAGRVWLDGRLVNFQTPRRAIDSGLAMLTNDRKATGLVLSLSVVANATLAAQREFSPGGWRLPTRELAAVQKLAEAMHLKVASVEAEVGTLSGGNQQKVAIAKWLQTRPKVLLLDEPTRGIDVAAKREIYQLLDQWTAEGMAIVLITSEMPELLSLSDRILVMHRGEITAEFTREQASPEAVLAAAMGEDAGNPHH